MFVTWMLAATFWVAGGEPESSPFPGESPSPISSLTLRLTTAKIERTERRASNAANSVGSSRRTRANRAVPRAPRRRAVLRQNSIRRPRSLICRLSSGHNPNSMISLLLHLLRLLPFLFGGHRQLALENLALRHQLAVYKRTGTRPRLRGTDRLFWVALAAVWAGWKQSLVIVTPDPVLRWQRRRFREHWTKLSGPPIGGRPPVNAEINVLVMRIAAD